MNRMFTPLLARITPSRMRVRERSSSRYTPAATRMPAVIARVRFAVIDDLPRECLRRVVQRRGAASCSWWTSMPEPKERDVENRAETTRYTPTSNSVDDEVHHRTAGR